MKSDTAASHGGSGVRRGGVNLKRVLREVVLHLLSLIHPRTKDNHCAEAGIDSIDSHLGATRLMSDEVTRLELGFHFASSVVDESLKRESFSSDNIILVARAEDFHDVREPPLRIGDIVMHNSGGPRMMIVDTTAESIVTAWRTGDGEVNEAEFPRPCCHRITPL